MKKHIAGILACFCIAAVSLSFNRAFAKELQPAPDFKLQDLDQKEYVLSANKDKNGVLMLFWTTWCPYCQDELKELNNIYPNFTKEGMEILGIDVEESANLVKNVVRSYGLKFRILLDTSGTVRKAYGVLGVPTYVLIDKSGNIVFKGNYFPKEKYRELISK